MKMKTETAVVRVLCRPNSAQTGQANCHRWPRKRDGKRTRPRAEEIFFRVGRLRSCVEEWTGAAVGTFTRQHDSGTSCVDNRQCA